MWKGRFFSTSTNFGMSRGFGISVRREPWRMASRHSVSAKMWYSGSAAMLLARLRSPILPSAGVNQASACSVAATMLRWVSTAPLDRPVVPPVYCRKAGVSGATRAGVSVRRSPRASARLKLITWRPPVRGSSYAGTILARWRTAKVIQRPYQAPSRSPMEAITTCCTAVWSITSASVCAKFSRMTMAVAPESLSWCSSSRAVYSGFTFTHV